MGQAAPNPPGRIVEIWLGPRAKEPLMSVDSVRALAGRGLEGDRYFHGRGSFDRAQLPTGGRAVTLIESEAISACQMQLADELGERQLTGADCRRNLVTRGLALHKLVGATFRFDDVVLVGIRLCPPCGLLDRVAEFDSRRGLKGRGGLRADVLESGRMSVGSTFELLEPGRGRLPL